MDKGFYSITRYYLLTTVTPVFWSSSILRPSLDKWRGGRRHHQTCLVDNQKCHVHESLTHCRRFCPGYSHMVVVTDGFTLVELPHRLDIVSWETDVGSDSLIVSTSYPGNTKNHEICLLFWGSRLLGGFSQRAGARV